MLVLKFKRADFLTAATRLQFQKGSEIVLRLNIEDAQARISTESSEFIDLEISVCDDGQTAYTAEEFAQLWDSKEL